MHILRFFALALALAAFPAFAQSPGGIGVGAFPLSRTTVSMWLLGGNDDGKPQPLMLVYFTGPEDWHQRRWESKFEGNTQKDDRVTYRLASSTVTLEVAVSADRQSAYVQGREFKLSDNNVFVVKNANDSQTQRIEGLGLITFPVEPAAPLAVAVLQKNPDLKARIE